ncbi:hypothetical protein MMC20_004855 [Loxospora ochrophaea]|nr:hypothetical protein [Loxospora ochrophaea]
MVVAFSKDPKEGIDDHYLFRTYDHPEALSQGNGNQSQPMNPGPAYSGPLWHAARATSAAPIYFESIKFDDRKFLDGGLGANNPGMIALKEVDQMHASSPVKPEILVSIGTGMKKEKKKTGKRKRAREEIYSFVHADTGRRKQFLKKYFELAKYAKDFTTNPQGIADNVKFGANKCGTQHERFDVEEGLGSIKLDDWRPPRGGDTTLEQIRKHTRVYLDLERTQTALQNCAITLVHLRRHRATTERWEKFATDIKYHCPAEDCKKGPAYMWHREHLRKHFEHRHQEVLKDLQDELETFIDTGRVGKLRQSPLETIVDAGRFKPGIFEEERPSHIQSALKRLSPRNTNLTSQSAPLDRLDPLENHNGSSRSVSRRLTRNTT